MAQRNEKRGKSMGARLAAALFSGALGLGVGSAHANVELGDIQGEIKLGSLLRLAIPLDAGPGFETGQLGSTCLRGELTDNSRSATYDTSVRDVMIRYESISKTRGLLRIESIRPIDSPLSTLRIVSSCPLAYFTKKWSILATPGEEAETRPRANRQESRAGSVSQGGGFSLGNSSQLAQSREMPKEWLEIRQKIRQRDALNVERAEQETAKSGVSLGTVLDSSPDAADSAVNGQSSSFSTDTSEFIEPIGTLSLGDGFDFGSQEGSKQGPGSGSNEIGSDGVANSPAAGSQQGVLDTNGPVAQTRADTVQVPDTSDSPFDVSVFPDMSGLSSGGFFEFRPERMPVLLGSLSIGLLVLMLLYLGARRFGWSIFGYRFGPQPHEMDELMAAEIYFDGDTLNASDESNIQVKKEKTSESITPTEQGGVEPTLQESNDTLDFLGDASQEVSESGKADAHPGQMLESLVEPNEQFDALSFGGSSSSSVGRSGRDVYDSVGELINEFKNNELFKWTLPEGYQDLVETTSRDFTPEEFTAVRISKIHCLCVDLAFRKAQSGEEVLQAELDFLLKSAGLKNLPESQEISEMGVSDLLKAHVKGFLFEAEEAIARQFTDNLVALKNQTATRRLCFSQENWAEFASSLVYA